MTKAERRKRARQRQKERERAPSVPVDSVEPLAESEADAATQAYGELETQVGVVAAPAAAPAAPAESPYITSAVVPKGPEAVGGALRAVPQTTTPAAPRKPAALAAVEAEIDEQDEQDQDGDDEDEDDEDEEFDDEDLEEAVFNVACGALERGKEYSWNELLETLLIVPVDDPRLGLLVAILSEKTDEVVGSDVVLQALERIELGELVEEARVAVASGEPEDDADQKELVKTTSRQLAQQSRAELGSKSNQRKPVKASQLREQRSALGSGVVPPAGGRK